MNILAIGVFDLLHINHINFLKKCKSLGKFLTVAVSTDNSCKNYKRQPIINENERLELIKNLYFVDKAFLIDNSWVNENILTKYKIDKLVHAHNEKEHLEFIKHADSLTNNLYSKLENEGRYIRLDYHKGISTSNIISKINKGVNKKILILGLGNITGHLIEFLSRTNFNGEICIISRNEDNLEKKCNNVMFGTCLQNLPIKNIKYFALDIKNNKEQLKKVLADFKPDIIVNGAVSQASQICNYKTTYMKGCNGWLVFGLNIIKSLLDALKELNMNPYILNTAQTDVIGCVFKKLGYNMEKFTGVGNINHNIPKIKYAIKKLYGYDFNRVQVKMISAHWFGNSLSKQKWSKCPYKIQISVDGKNITDKLNLSNIFDNTKINIPPGKEHNHFVASEIITVIESLSKQEKTLIHCCNVFGYPGGYPCLINKDGIKISLFDNITLDEAININWEGNKLDGLEEINENGEIIVTEECYNLFLKFFNYDCRKLKINEWESREIELNNKYNIFSKNN